MPLAVLVDRDHDHASLPLIVRELATHPGNAIARLEFARILWGALEEESFPDALRFAFRHLTHALRRPYPKAMGDAELLAWAGFLCARIVAFAELVRDAEDDGAPQARPSGIRIRSTRRASRR